MRKTADYCEEANEMVMNGHTYAEVSAKFGVSRQAAYGVVARFRRRQDVDLRFKLVKNPNLKEWMTQHCESLEEFADMLHVKMAEIYRFFRTETRTLTIPLKIQEITGLPLEDIIIRKDKRNEN